MYEKNIKNIKNKKNEFNKKLDVHNEFSSFIINKIKHDIYIYIYRYEIHITK